MRVCGWSRKEGDKKVGEQFAAFIKEADALFTKKDYEPARAKYQAALDIKETEAHPKARLKEIEGLLAELAKKTRRGALGQGTAGEIPGSHCSC